MNMNAVDRMGFNTCFAQKVDPTDESITSDELHQEMNRK